MPTYTISGLEVEFPYEAYECQLAYMDAVIRALNSGQHALLESPTGTGKTLCLLCATLAWRRHRATEVSKARLSWEAQADGTGAVPVQNPQIWYSSRTHSQLRQVVKELKQTSYTPSSVALGSREHSCLHSSVSRQTGARQTVQCRRARDENRCPFYVGFRKGVGSKINTSMLDIEGIVDACKEHQVCPYYKSREDAKSSDLLFIPYDYLINPVTRESLQVPLKGSILIFDEGHNIEKSCEEVASFEFSGKDLAGAMDEIDSACFVLESETDSCEEAMKDMTAEMLMAHLNLLKKQLLALEDVICGQDLSLDEASQRYMFKGPGSYILQLLSRGSMRGDGITEKDMKRITQVIKKAILVLTFSTEGNQNAGAYLDNLLKILHAAFFRQDPHELDKHYQVLIYEDATSRRGTKRKSLDFFSTAVDADTPGASRVVCFWCFSCSIALRDLEQLGVHSIIVTSGTLSPLEATVESFGIPFPVVLENQHVINTAEQVFGGVLTSGPTGQVLNGSYSCRSEPKYVEELGRSVEQLVTRVPDGVLLAFQSYAQKDRILSQWRQSGTLDDISKHKPLFDEPQGNAEMKLVMDRFNTALVRPKDVGRPGGGILAAVCRGKLCEGIDFTDKQCRLVILVGVPYPSLFDLRVMLKQDFLDRQSRSIGGGKAWYTREAIRAVNQTVGRVIRHRADFGGVFLCDERYSSGSRLAGISLGLSAWLRPAVNVFNAFSDAVSSCHRFFGVHMPLPPASAEEEEVREAPAAPPSSTASSAASGATDKNPAAFRAATAAAVQEAIGPRPPPTPTGAKPQPQQQPQDKRKGGGGTGSGGNPWKLSLARAERAAMRGTRAVPAS